MPIGTQMLTFIKFKSMTATKKQTVATPTPKHSATRTSTNGKFNSKPNGSAVASSVKLKPEPILSPEEQAEALVKQVRNYIHKKYAVAIQRRESRIGTKVGHAVREKLGLDIQAQLNKRNGNGNGKKFDWNEWNNTVFPKLFGRPDTLKYDVEVVALAIGKLYDTISETPDEAISDLIEFNTQSLKRRNELAKNEELSEELDDDDLDSQEDEEDYDDEIDDILDEADSDEDDLSESEDDDEDEFELDEEEEFEEDD